MWKLAYGTPFAYLFISLYFYVSQYLSVSSGVVVVVDFENDAPNTIF